MHTRVTLLLMVVLSAAAPAAHAQSGNGNSAAHPAGATTYPGFDIRTIDPRTFSAIATRLDGGQAPVIDGRLDDEVWALAQPAGHFVQREPIFGAPATEQTEFRILYDDRTLYFGVSLFDSDPSKIIASEMKRDSGLQKGDQLKIAIDTLNDRRNSFTFFTSPLATMKDANTVENGRTINYDWNAVWVVRTTIDDRGWYAEIAIPLSQLRFPNRIGEATWGLNICRILMRKNEESYWVPFPREWGASGFSRMSNAGTLRGLANLNVPRRIEATPFLAPKVVRDFDAGTSTRATSGYGFDARVGVTTDLSADFTYRTDFAQVEADQEVVNLTRFDLFFPEKRQFFTESGGIFDYGRSGQSPGGDAGSNDPGLLALFYSRRIGLVDGQEVPLLGGGKLTGHVGPYALGLVNITTDPATIGSGGARRSLPRTNFTAVRIKRNVLSKSTIGGILLNREGGPTAYNRSAGLDAGFLFGSHVTLTGLFATTFSPGVAGRGTAAVVDFIWKSDRFNYGATYADIGRRLNAEMGYIPRLDIRNTRAKAAWTPRPRWRGVRQVLLTGAIDRYDDHAGRRDSETDRVDFQIQRQSSSSITATIAHDYDRLDLPRPFGAAAVPVGTFEWTTGTLQYSSNRSKRITGSAAIDAGSFYNGRRQSLRTSLSFLFGRTLLIEPNYTRNQIALPAQARFVSNTLSTRVSYSLSTELFVKGFLQYNDDRRTASLNLLFWYIYRPGSDLYVVYNNGWETPLARLGLIRVRNRSLSVKVTYWKAR